MDNQPTSLIEASRVQDTNVYNVAGEKLGAVHDLMIDKRTGNTSYAVVSFGGFLGVGENYFPIPWSKLKYDEKLGGYVTDIEIGALEGAPRLCHRRRAALGGPRLRRGTPSVLRRGSLLGQPDSPLGQAARRSAPGSCVSPRSQACLRRFGEQAARRAPSAVALFRHNENCRPDLVVVGHQRHHHSDVVATHRGGTKSDAAMTVNGAITLLDHLGEFRRRSKFVLNRRSGEAPGVGVVAALKGVDLTFDDRLSIGGDRLVGEYLWGYKSKTHYKSEMPGLRAPS